MHPKSLGFRSVLILNIRLLPLALNPILSNKKKPGKPNRAGNAGTYVEPTRGIPRLGCCTVSSVATPQANKPRKRSQQRTIIPPSQGRKRTNEPLGHQEERRATGRHGASYAPRPRVTNHLGDLRLIPAPERERERGF